MNPIDYANCDGVELAGRIASGSISAAEVIETSWRIIEAVDDPIHAFVALEKDLTREALEAARAGPLAGVPIAMKDCVGFVAGALRNFGTRLRPSLRPDYDDEVVSRYRAGGLVPLGTTNVPELSSCLTTESRLHGPCRNPWNLAYSTGGSTGGGAAAVAYGAVPIAYGNDSAGSIRIPASCCGVFGLRPSRGRVPLGPRDGEIWYGLLSHHVITRSVRDSALVLDLSEGTDAGAPYGAKPKARPYLEECQQPAMPLRIAVSDGSAQGFALDPECAEALAATVERLRGMGHLVAAASPEYSGNQMIEAITLLMAVALAEELPGLARRTGRPIVPETVECTLRALMELGKRASAVELATALAFRNTAGRALGRLLGDFDLLLTPTLAMPPAPLGWLDADSADIDDYLNRMWRYSPFTPLANLSGAPSMSVPLASTRSGLPIGMMFTARYGEEGMLFRTAAALERAYPWKDAHPPHGVWSIIGSE